MEILKEIMNEPKRLKPHLTVKQWDCIEQWIGDRNKKTIVIYFRKSYVKLHLKVSQGINALIQ